jgi:hypothetical protein
VESVSAVDAFLASAVLFAAVQDGAVGVDTIVARFLWELIDDAQSANWATIGDAQTPNWATLTTAQTASWATINDTQTPGWTTIDDAQSGFWAVIGTDN